MKNAQGFTFHLPTAEVPANAVEERSGRFYIVMGFAGFNTHANNRNGYASYSDALKAVTRFDRGNGGVSPLGSSGFYAHTSR